MPGKFIVKKGTSGKFRFSLLSTNGRVVASSETYESKAAAMGGIRSVQKLAGEAAVEDQTTTAWAKQQDEAKALKSARKTAAKKAEAGRKAAAKKASATTAAAGESTAPRKTATRKAAPRKAAARKSTSADNA